MVRIKERYLLVNIIYPEASRDQSKNSISDILVYNQPTVDTFNGRTFTRAIKNEITNLFGDYGAGAVERTLRVKYQSNATSTCIIQCSREHYRLVWAALTMINRVPTKDGPGKPCIFQVKRVSGTIKQVEQEAVRRARLLILAARDEMAGKESDALGALFGTKDSTTNDVTMVDGDNGSDSEADFEDDDD
ncbi:RNA-binding protein pop5 [Gnomoniopsis smithogilvyi]|uniref:Ribonuclease P/MRP protein subunit POP5 n=1 Tax=Gnomoniopsis smithogilvyi TaxID=1191159 RepID=A0A9W8YRC1_9PEZI|nr:RNA-binding protein pop5 [Gnomoniopsis smithogilvyi]